MANKREPYVEGHRVDSSVSTTVSDSRVNVYVGIEADTGTYDLTYQQTPKVFVQEYSTKAKPDTNDASTLLHAGKLVENFGIYVKRVNKDPILPGIVSTNKYGEVGYFDTNYNLLKNITEFSVVPRETPVNSQKLAMVIDNVLYINKNVADEIELDSLFKNAPYYWDNGGHQELMSTLLNGSDVFNTSREDAKVVPVTTLVEQETVVAFYAINVGAKYSAEDFLAAVSSYAKNYRSNNDAAEFLSYDADSLMMSIDISAFDDTTNAKPIQACTTLVNTPKLTKAMTKLEFTEGGNKQLLTNTRYYSDARNSAIKYLDIGGFRYYPKIGTDTHNYAESTVTPKPSKFGYMSDDFDALNCSVSDGILSSIDTMLTESDTVKPDSVYCSTEQVFGIHVGKEEEQGLTLLPSANVQLDAAGQVYIAKSGFYGDGFETTLAKLQILCQPTTGSFKWVDFEGDTQVSKFYIDNEGYAFIKVTFDGQINDVSDKKAGFCLLYGTFNQAGTPASGYTTGMLLFGKNVAKEDVTSFEVSTSGDSVIVDPDVRNITANTTDLGMICSLPWVRFGSNYTFNKVVTEPSSSALSSGSGVGLLVDNETVLSIEGIQGVEPSRINKLYLYFMNNRNITSGITGYDEQCWKKYSTVMQKNYTFDPQSKISAGLPGYHAILVGQTTKEGSEVPSGGKLYYNGNLDIPDESPDLSDPGYGSGYTPIPIASIALTAAEFIEKLEGALRNNYTYISKLSDGSYIIGEPIEKPFTPVTSGIKVTDYMEIDQDSNFANARYAIIQRFTSAAKLFSIDLSFDKTDKEIIKFVNSYNGTEYTDKISFNVSKIDGYGTNISYKSYNLFDGRSFFIKVLNEEAPVIEMKVNSFGNDITPKKATSQDYVNALDDLVTDEFKPSFLWDAGLCQTDYTNAMSSLAETTYSMVPISVPKSAESAADVKAWKANFNTDNPVQYVLDGWHYNTVFGDISFECCPTYYYLVGKLSNANSITKEFQPMFYKTRGIVSAGVPVRNVPLTKKEREDLLDVRVNSIVRNKANSISYINQNFTNQQVESDFSEEQNVCISNEVCRSADNYADNNIISKNNTPNLRAQVTSELTNILRARILDSRGDDTAKSFYVECNDVNNPKAIIDARKLVIDIYVTYNKSINAVLVYSRTKSLDQG